MLTGRSLTVSRSLLPGRSKKKSKRKIPPKNWGVLSPREVYLVPKDELSFGGVLSPGVYLVPGDVLSPGGILSPGVSGPWGVSGPGGWYPIMHWGKHPHCGQTDACKNITLATTSLRPVIKNTKQIAECICKVP